MADYPASASKSEVHHVESRTKEYRAYIRMIHRCHNRNYDGYQRYGARGIIVCNRWRNSYVMFLADMGRAPSPDHSIERKENNAGYSPENCVWATRTEQANNRRTSRFITFRGRRQTMTQWAREMNVSRKKLWKRLKLGWPIEDVLKELPGAH